MRGEGGVQPRLQGVFTVEDGGHSVVDVRKGGVRFQRDHSVREQWLLLQVVGKSAS